MAESAFHHGTARLPGGWIMRRGRIDEHGFDVRGWWWGGELPVWHLQPEGIDDSLTVRAPCPVAALALIVTSDGWPPRHVKRYNWEYGDDRPD